MIRYTKQMDVHRNVEDKYLSSCFLGSGYRLGPKDRDPCARTYNISLEVSMHCVQLAASL